MRKFEMSRKIFSLDDRVVVSFSEWEPKKKDTIWENKNFFWNCIPWGLHDKVTGHGGYGAMIPESFSQPC